MDLDRCQHLAERLHALLMQQLGMGLDAQRMLNEPLYARDVLLVCAAHPGTELATLAWEYRDAAAPPPARAPGPASAQARKRRPEHPPVLSVPPVLPVPPVPPLAPTAPASPRAARPVHTLDAGDAADLVDSQPEPARARSPLSRFSRLSLSRFGASIFGGSLFEGTLFGRQQADPVTDFGDDSYLAPLPTRQGGKGGKGRESGKGGQGLQGGTAPAAPRRSRWFGR